VRACDQCIPLSYEAEKQHKRLVPQCRELQAIDGLLSLNLSDAFVHILSASSSTAIACKSHWLSVIALKRYCSSQAAVFLYFHACLVGYLLDGV
jgi:hypothetical protein